MWKPIVSASKRALISLFFPSLCLHCKEKIQDQGLLCSFCSEQMEFFPFTRSVNKVQPFDDMSVAMEPQGASLSLLAAKEGNESALITKTIAAFQVMALQRLDWPSVDCIIPSPDDLLFHKMIAKEMSFFLQVPVVEELVLSFWTKKMQWKRKVSITGEVVLVVGALQPKNPEDFFLLQEAAPKKLFFLSFC